MDSTIYVEPERCLGCSSCEVACAVAHSRSEELFEAIQEGLCPEPRLQVELVGDHPVPLHCLHCSDAPCVQVCPSGAMVKSGDGGPVVCHSERCVGCSLCVLACPYGVLRLDRSGKTVVKCDLCVARMSRGLEPACAEACPSAAIQFLSLDEVDRREGNGWRTSFLVVYRGQSALVSEAGG